MDISTITLLLSNNTISVVLGIDLIAGIFIIKRTLHPILGRFDIALILQPLGTDDDTPKPKKGMSEEEQKEYVNKYFKGKILTMAYRKEFPVLSQAFRIGKKDNGFTYRVNPKKVAFLQHTHRVYEYIHDLAYPINVSYGSPDRLTTSKGMDMYIALKLWGQALTSTAKQNLKAPVLVIILALIAGLMAGFTIFYAAHEQLGFVPIVAQQVANHTNSTTTVATTATLRP